MKLKILSLKNLCRFRLIFAGIFLILFISIFSGMIVFRSNIFSITRWQIMPRVLTAVALGGLYMIGSTMVIAIATAFCGRLYCSWLCPLGLIQDLTERLSRKITGKKRSYRKRNLPLRLAAFVVFGILLFSGFILLIGYLEPYSLFGKIASGVLHTILVLFNQSTLELEQNATGLATVSSIYLSISAGVLLGVIAISTLFGRIFCNTLCPAGTLLSAIAAKSGRRLAIDQDKCVNCGKCEQVCNANCINIAEHRIDFVNCFMCLECVSNCPQQAITLKRRRKSDLNNVDMPDMQERRKILIAAGTAGVGALAAGKLLKKAGKVPEDAIAPPGAGSVEKFLASCTGCGLCMSNCTGGCLQPATTEYGWKGFMLPTMKFSGKKPGKCEYNCHRCSSICPTGALRKLTRDEKKRCRIGMAYFYSNTCLAYQEGKSCGACQEHCPTSALTMIPGPKGATIPSVNQDLCIGCGNCEYACPATPKAIRVKGIAKHSQAADKNKYAEQQPAKKPQEGLDFLKNLQDEE